MLLVHWIYNTATWYLWYVLCLLWDVCLGFYRKKGGLFAGHVVFKMSRVGSGQEVFKISRFGSSQEVFKSRGSGRVGSGNFQISRVGSSRVGSRFFQKLADRVEPGQLTQPVRFDLTREKP